MIDTPLPQCAKKERKKERKEERKKNFQSWLLGKGQISLEPSPFTQRAPLSPSGCGESSTRSVKGLGSRLNFKNNFF